MMGGIRIGISGWRYKGWRGKFYPDGLVQRRELAYAAARFRSIEINGTFYSLQRPEFFARWAQETPDDFVFAVKGPRFITHNLKLARPEIPLANFFGSGILRLSRKLGPVLWQLPPSLRFDADRLAAFFTYLPRTSFTAAALAEKHDHRVAGPRFWAKPDANTPIRHALEIRHESFCDPAFVTLLRKHRIGLVVADTVDWPLLMDVTAGFVYCRLHGSKKLYTSGYDAPDIRVWARRVVAWAHGGDAPRANRIADPAPKRAKRDVFVYFDNDAKVRAPFDALALEAEVDRLLKRSQNSPQRSLHAARNARDLREVREAAAGR
jgi:uncharacterized protein YecE (DUF72 family)